jgi:galactose mutarotase-like enzyme
LDERNMEEIELGNRAGDLVEVWTERAVLKNGFLRIEVMPALGGKITSIQLVPGGDELLQRPLLPYAPRIPFMHFDDSDASGWDECLPSVAACSVQTSSGIVSVPDHGDFWQVAWQLDSLHENDLTLSADGFSLPLRFAKSLRLEDNRLRIAYRVQNSGTDSVEYVWSAHPLFTVDAGDRIVLPSSVKEVIVEGGGGRLGPRGTKHPWPQTRAINGEMSDLSIAGEITDEIGDKLFTAAPSEGWCAIDRISLKRRIELHFDAREVPNLGLWICYGGWPENRANRQNCVALEPCTTDGDSLTVAMTQGRARQIAPGREDRWTIELRVTGVS